MNSNEHLSYDIITNDKTDFIIPTSSYMKLLDIIETPLKVVGVIGKENSGKNYMISRLCRLSQKDLTKYKSQNNKDLLVKNKDNILFLNAIIGNWSEEFIKTISDFVILMMDNEDKSTYNILRSNKEKKVKYVIHNSKENNHITEESLMLNFQVNKCNKGNISYFIDYIDNKNDYIIHYILHDNIEMIVKEISNDITYIKGNKLNIINKIKEFIEKNKTNETNTTL